MKPLTDRLIKESSQQSVTSQHSAPHLNTLTPSYSYVSNKNLILLQLILSLATRLSPLATSMSSSGDTSSELSTSTDGSIKHMVDRILFPAQHQATWAVLAEWHLCSTCENLLKWQVDGESLQLQPAKIRKSKDDGCRFCDVLCEAATWAKLWVEDGNRQSKDTWYEVFSFNVVAVAYLNTARKMFGLKP